jgi:hypothetical protein
MFDAMNTGQAAVIWVGTVGIETIRVAIVCGWRSCNGGGEEVRRR